MERHRCCFFHMSSFVVVLNFNLTFFVPLLLYQTHLFNKEILSFYFFILLWLLYIHLKSTRQNCNVLRVHKTRWQLNDRSSVVMTENNGQRITEDFVCTSYIEKCVELFFSVILGILNYTKAFSIRLHDRYKLSKMNKKNKKKR